MTQESSQSRNLSYTKWMLRYLRHGHYLGTAIVLTIFVILLFESSTLNFGSLAAPGPGLWPISVSILGVTLCAIALRVGKQMPEAVRRVGAIRVTFAILAVVCIPLFYDYTGFVPIATIAMIGMLRVVGKESWIQSIATAIISALAIYGVFGVLLDIPLQGFPF